MSVRRSTRSGKSFSIDLAKKYVLLPRGIGVHRPAHRFDAREMSTALRRGVPLNSMCSMKCATPLSAGVSAREPTGTQIPTVADRSQGTCSVTMADAVVEEGAGDRHRRRPSTAAFRNAALPPPLPPRPPSRPRSRPGSPFSLSRSCPGGGPVASGNRPSSSNSLWESRIFPSRSTSSTRTVTSSPSLKQSATFTRCFDIWETWSRPSVPGRFPRRRRNP